MASRGEIISYNAEQLYEWLDHQSQFGEDTLESFKQNRIDGRAFFELSGDDLRELVPPLGDRKAAQRLIKSYTPEQPVSTGGWSVLVGQFVGSGVAECFRTKKAMPPHTHTPRFHTLTGIAIPTCYMCKLTRNMVCPCCHSY